MGLLLKNKYVLLFIALLAVSSSAWVVRFLPELSATTIAFWRMLLASLMAFAISYKTILTFVPNKKVLLAGIFLGFHFALFFRSVQLTSIAEAALLGTIAPVFTEVYSIVFQKKGFSIKVFFGRLLLFWVHTRLLAKAVLATRVLLVTYWPFFVLLQWRLCFLLEKMLGRA